jgi:DNA-binding CsgD family transcriptional regulator
VQLVGRDAELAAAGRALEQARHGAGRVLGVLGEAGIGKSALLAATAERARAAGLRVIEGRGVEHERDVPFGVAVAALDEHVGALPIDAPAAGAAERFHHHRAIRAALERLGAERPLALLLDDLHWADEASIELVLHLMRRPPAVGHLLAFGARAGGPAARLLDAARSAVGWEQLVLAPLGHDASLALLTDVGDARRRERLAREAAGNPLFLRELARSPADGALPPTLLATVAGEVAALDPAARALVEGAAVAGDPFDPELAAETAGLGPGLAEETAGPALDRLVQAGLVRPTGHGRAFAFRHPLVRRAVYDRTAPGWRLAAHERAAAALERRGAPAAARAYHVARCAQPGDPAAIALLCEAAEASAGVSPAATAHWYATALELATDRQREQRSGLLERLALALASAGRLAEARDALLEALRDPGPLRLELAVICARIETQLGRHAEARRRLLAQREHAGPEQQADLAIELAAVAFHTGRGDDVRAWAEPAVRAAERAGRPAMLAGAQAFAALGRLWTGDPDGAAAWLDRANPLLDELDDAALSDVCVLGPTLVGVAQNLTERFAAASATSARTLAIARRTGQEQGRVTLLGLRAVTSLCLIDLDDALQHADAAEEVARLQGIPHLLHFALWVRALVHEQRGEVAELDRAVRDAAAAAGALEPSKLERTCTCEFAFLDATQSPERAIAAALDAAGPTWRSKLLLRLVRAAIEAGRLEDAERWALQAVAHTWQLRLPAGATRAACARAEVLLARGEAGTAAALAGDAAAGAVRAGAPLDALEARVVAGRSLAAAHHPERAKAELHRAVADAGRSGALRLRDAAARELRRLGARVSAEARRGARAGDGELTERERDIARLVASGRSNKQVASTLFLSEKTVENALTRVYAKLGVRSRAQLSGAASAALRPAG